MLIKGKKIMVMGIGITGVSALKLLAEHNNELFVYDEKPELEIKEILIRNQLINVEVIQEEMINMVQDVDFIVKSPGIPPDNMVIKFAMDKGIPVISDIELAYNLGIQGTIIGITGTNGKTTSTILAGEILNNNENRAHLAGNMGTGVLQVVENVQKEDYLVLELSSFQLEHTYLFKPKVSLILNITEDHLDWHGTFDNYKASKFKIFANQSGDDYLVLNKEDENLRNIEGKTRASIIWFSAKKELAQGVFINNGSIIYRNNESMEIILSLEDIKIPGVHNIENICGVVGVMKALGIDNDTIRTTIRNFKGVEHRIEYVGKWNGVDFYNDSKGTNVESTTKAIEAINNPIVLIAGGYNKGANYDKFLKALQNKSRALVLIGETKEDIERAAENIGIKVIYKAINMEDAVNKAISIAKIGDAVLLSPACASWDFYQNFEERGNHFKRIVKDLTE
ncbi:UDP-N-acetylmuramoyl-L-alanine--D-glutamate ligase [Gudongella sp. DL1XJH-153]|uniref:UDP-N-acetylmuramoyl-L-alanine--D-glutamate ligase n=1 Tax=Gudongella sp. DL1XJH-153 TaxID=3409804 RepID=UPI003BB5B4E2